MKLDLYYYDQCPFCQIVLRKIQQLKLEEFITLKNTLVDSSNRQFHQNTTGRTTVPCLYIDDEPMFESYDIAQWLEDNEDRIRK